MKRPGGWKPQSEDGGTGNEKNPGSSMAVKCRSSLELLLRESDKPVSYKLLTGLFCYMQLAWPKRVATRRGIDRRVGGERVSLGLQVLPAGRCSDTRGQVLRTSLGKDRIVQDGGGDGEAPCS